MKQKDLVKKLISIIGNQKAVASAADVSQPVVSRWLHEKTYIPLDKIINITASNPQTIRLFVDLLKNKDASTTET